MPPCEAILPRSPAAANSRRPGPAGSVRASPRPARTPIAPPSDAFMRLHAAARPAAVVRAAAARRRDRPCAVRLSLSPPCRSKPRQWLASRLALRDLAPCGSFALVVTLTRCFVPLGRQGGRRWRVLMGCPCVCSRLPQPPSGSGRREIGGGEEAAAMAALCRRIGRACRSRAAVGAHADRAESDDGLQATSCSSVRGGQTGGMNRNGASCTSPARVLSSWTQPGARHAHPSGARPGRRQMPAPRLARPHRAKYR